MPDNLRDMLILDEGRKAKKYTDSEGYWTIGVGHLIDNRKGGSLPLFIVQELDRRGIDIYARNDALPEDLIDKLLDYDIALHVGELEVVQPWVKTLDAVRHAAISDMCFNLGIEPFDHDGFKDWPMFIEQMRTCQWGQASANMLSTRWATQVGKRAQRLAKMVRSGVWPDDA